MAKLISSETNLWTPEYEGIDLTDYYAQKIGEIGCEFIYFKDDDGFQFQVTEENSCVFVNQTHEDMNAVAIVDPRDLNAWWWFKGTHEVFDDMLETVAPHASFINTIIPRPEVVRNFMRVSELDLADYIPDDWQ